MYTYRSPLLLACFLLLILVAAGCRIPRVPVRQTADLMGEFTVGDQRVRAYRARDFLQLDTSARILRYEYLPVTFYTVIDKRDSVRLYVVAAWQEYLWRFSERLRQVDKQYFTPSPLAVNFAGDSAVVVWGYPNVEARDRDLRHVVPRRNSYWSVDVFEPRSVGDERFQGVLRSYPQHESYDPLLRFARGGQYERALSDSAYIGRVLHDELFKIMAENGIDTSRASR